MERYQHAVVQILSHLGQVWVYASYKPELLTTSMMVFDWERSTFGDEMISIASYRFQKISRVNIEQHECCVIFCDISRFVWTFLCINWFFNAFMCIIKIWTTCTCSSAYKLVEKSNLCPWVHGRSHARNGNEFQTPGHRWLPAKHWDACFLDSSKYRTRLKFMKLGMLSLSGINMSW